MIDVRQLIPSSPNEAIYNFYPDADPETTSVDGFIERLGGSGVDWATIHDALAGSSVGADLTDLQPLLNARGVAGEWQQIRRAFVLFDTSSLPDGANILAAILHLYSRIAATNSFSWMPSINIYSSSPASNTDLVIADYDQVGAVEFSTSVPFNQLTAGAWIQFPLNSNGLAAISKTDITKFSIREAVADAPNVDKWEANASCLAVFHSADIYDGDFPPRLEVVVTV